VRREVWRGDGARQSDCAISTGKAHSAGRCL